MQVRFTGHRGGQRSVRLLHSLNVYKCIHVCTNISPFLPIYAKEFKIKTRKSYIEVRHQLSLIFCGQLLFNNLPLRLNSHFALNVKSKLRYVLKQNTKYVNCILPSSSKLSSISNLLAEKLWSEKITHIVFFTTMCKQRNSEEPVLRYHYTCIIQFCL